MPRAPACFAFERYIFVKTLGTLLCCLILSTAAVHSRADDGKPFVDVKRSALWVPDLDRAIVFYRDVLGFTVVDVGELTPKQDSVLLDLFNTDAERTFRRAMFSSSTDENALFVMETKDAPRYGEAEQRHSVLVIRTRDLDAVVARAAEHGFETGNTNLETPASSGITLRETTVFGPGGQAVLVYQLLTGQQLAPTYRHSILVADLERSLTLYRDVLGLELGRVSDTAPDSYSYVFFNIPRGAMKRFAYFNGAGGQKNVLGIGEVPGIELKLPDRPRPVAWVQTVNDVEGVMDKLTGLGLELIPPKEFISRETGQPGIETGVVDFDGHLVMIYGMKRE
jgi:catechol 2,3-dioxygenase-like lactoylglutathione lyase family enzyme